jgi:pimeloyl-ACP methyl ester carboxylesterase
MVHHQPLSRKRTTGRIHIMSWLLRGLTGGLSRLAPGPAAVLAEKVFLSARRYRTPRRELTWAAAAERSTVPTDAGELATWTWGSAEPTVLLVHGWAGRGMQLGGFVAPMLETGFRVVTFDAPGHGDSPGRRSSLPEMASAVEAVVRHLGRVDAIVAHSLGASATIAAIGRAPAPLGVGRLVTIAPSVDFDAVGEQFAKLSGFTPAVVRRMRRRIEKRFGIRWREIEAAALGGNIDLPLLVVHDRDDRDVGWLEGAALADSWPGARLMSTNRLGHRRILRDAAVLDEVARFASGGREAAEQAISLSLQAAAPARVARLAGAVG